MSRFYTHDLDTAPPETRTHLERYIKTSPTGKILNLHGAMAHAPIVLEMYARMRSTLEEMGNLDGKAQWAAMLAGASINQASYSATLYAMLGRRHGLTEEQIAAISQGGLSTDEAVDALVTIAREVASNHGRVSARAWNDAVAAGWTGVQLGEVFACLALAQYVDYFANYGEVEFDLRRPVEA